MLRSALMISLFALATACDDASGTNDTLADTVDGTDTQDQELEIVVEGDVRTSNVVSHYETCSSLSFASLRFDIVNAGSQIITPQRIEVVVSSGTMSRGFINPAPISPGAIVRYECFGGFSGQLGGDTNEASVTLRFSSNGVERSVEGLGAHTSAQDFDNCDTAFPQNADSDCVIVDE